MKSLNWISGTGLRPYMAIPMTAPMIPPSASGVSMTRVSPNSSQSRAQVLSQREDVAVDRAQIAHRLHHLFPLLAQPEHDRALRPHAPALVVTQDGERLAVARAAVADAGRQALDGFEIVGRDRRRSV